MVGGFDTDPGTSILVFDFDGGLELDVHPFGILLLEPVLGDGLCEEPGASVQDGNLKIIDFYDCVIHAHAGKSRHKMFDGRYARLSLGDESTAGCVGDILGKCGNLYPEIGPDENDSGICSGRLQCHVGERSGVQAFSLEPIYIF